MIKTQNSKQYNLEERTFCFAKNVRNFIKKLPKFASNVEYIKQLIRSSASIAANYIEANESLSKKDFMMRVKICRKETKETILWLNLVEPVQKDNVLRERLLKEATEIMKIFGAIVTSVENRK